MSPLNFVLRAFRGTWESDLAVESTIAFLRKARFQGLMFWWGYGHWDPNHITDVEMKARARRIAQVIPKFKRAGFSTGLNIHTIGFTYSPPDTHEFGFQYQMGNDGAPNRNSACPLCPRFHKYLDRLFTTFALHGLEYVFVDDDFDYMVGGSACHCPLHMAAFSKAVGRKYTRETWLRTIRAPGFKPGALSEAWRSVQTEALLDCGRVMERALHRHDPNIRLGPMGINGWVCNRGVEATNRLLDICRGPRNLPAVVRPSSGAYWDWQRWQAHGACSLASEIYLRTVLPKDATRYIELDMGAPWTVFDHGVEHARFVTERTVATGERTIAWISSSDGPTDLISRDDPYALMLGKNRTRFDSIAELVGENPVFEGVDARTGEQFDADPRHDHFFGIAAFSLARIGLALAPTGEWCTVVFGQQPWTIGRERIESYLSRGALVDAGAMAAMGEMCCSGLIGDAGVADWSPGEVTSTRGAMSLSGTPVGLEMAKHPLNGSAAGKLFSNLGGMRKRCRRLVGKFKTSEVLSWWVDPSFQRLGPAEVAIERNGRRFVLLAYGLDYQTPEQQILVANPIRQQMFHNACEWIAQRPLPAVIKDGADVHLFCMRSPNGQRRILTLVNNGFNKFEELTLQIASLPRENSTIRTVASNGTIQRVKKLPLRRLTDRCELKLPRTLVPGPMELRVLAFD